METESNYPRYVFTCRHAEKVSNITGIKTPNTHITQNGENQASECGLHISKEISKLDLKVKDDSVLIIVSPFLRCLQSAKYIITKLRAKGIKIYNDTLYISSQIKENQKGKNGKRKLFISGEELRADLEEFKKEHPDYKIERSEFQLENEDEEYNTIEEKSDLKRRFGSFLKAIGAAKTIDGYKGQVVICVSHAMFLKQIKVIYKEENPEKEHEKVEYVYGAVSCLKYATPEKWDLMYDGIHEHLIVAGLNRYGTYGSKDFKRMDTDPVESKMKSKLEQCDEEEIPVKKYNSIYIE